MSLVSLIVPLVILGLILWVIHELVPMDPAIRKVINVVVAVFLVLWMLQVFGLIGPVVTIR